MNYEWLNKNSNNKNIIVFFGGWGQSKSPFENNFSDYDILMFYDYETFEEINFDFSNYEKKYLIAWSMGVFVCNYYYEIFKDFNKLTAINGTQKPIDDVFGIPEIIYNLTVENFNELSCTKFIKKMAPSISSQDYCTRTINELRNELIAIRDLKPINFLKFDKAIISEKDKIIPALNQQNWWRMQNVQIIKLENAPHYIFNLYNNWSDLI